MWETVLARRIQFAGIWILQMTLSFSVRDQRRVKKHTDTCVHTCTQTCEPHTRKDMWAKEEEMRYIAHYHQHEGMCGPNTLECTAATVSLLPKEPRYSTCCF